MYITFNLLDIYLLYLCCVNVANVTMTCLRYICHHHHHHRI